MDEQYTFEFTDYEEKISFIPVSGECTCGKEYNVKCISIALEMTIRCQKCGRQIKIKK